MQTGTVGPNPRDGFWVGPGGISSISSNGLMILFNFIYFHFIGLRGVLFLKIWMTVRDMRKQPLLICVFTRISHAVVTTDPHTALAHVRCLAHCLQRAHAHTHPCQLLYNGETGTLGTQNVWTAESRAGTYKCILNRVLPVCIPLCVTVLYVYVFLYMNICLCHFKSWNSICWQLQIIKFRIFIPSLTSAT